MNRFLNKSPVLVSTAFPVESSQVLDALPGLVSFPMCHSNRKITDCIKIAEDIFMYEKRKVCNNF